MHKAFRQTTLDLSVSEAFDGHCRAFGAAQQGREQFGFLWSLAIVIDSVYHRVACRFAVRSA